MTELVFNVTFGDADFVALHAAVKFYMAKCEDEIGKGNTIPYEPHLIQLEEFMQRVADSATDEMLPQLPENAADVSDALHAADSDRRRFDPDGSVVGPNPKYRPPPG